MHAFLRLRLKRRALTLFLPLLLITAVLAGLGFARPAEARHDARRIGLGDDIVEIALDYNTTPETLRWLNNMPARQPIWTGQTLRVPPAQNIVLYSVRPGDTPGAIAAAHGMALAQLVEYNKISPIRHLRAGDKLLVYSAEGFGATQDYPHHVVAAGETLESIAATYRADARTVAAANALGRNEEPAAGTVLVVPLPPLSDRLSETPRDAAGNLVIPLEDFPSLTEKWVDVDLAKQTVTAYEGTRPVANFLISSGKARTPTVQGVFRIRAKVSSQTMSGGSKETGDYYNLPGVKWVSYFYGGYSFHGTYWHHNFGHPMSHGCINMTDADAEWIYNWMAPTNPGRGLYYTPPEAEGTLVVVHE